MIEHEEGILLIASVYTTLYYFFRRKLRICFFVAVTYAALC